ncbi:MAG: anti-sigma factor [Deltaproteobacteria bacterium]
MKGDPLHPRGEELLAERALRPLDDKEHRELQQLGVDDDDSFDRAAAAVVVATTVMEPMPAALMESILAKAPGAGTLDWKRTLPGVSMPPPADLPRDTLVGVELSDLAPKDQPTTEPLIAQKEIAATKLMGVPSAALQTLPPPMVKRPPAIRTPLPQDSQPFSVDTPPPAVPITRDRSTPIPVLPAEVVTMPSRDEIAQRRAERRDAVTVPLRPGSRSVLPWLAAAACLLVAGGAVWWAYTQKSEPTTLPTVATSPATERAALLSSATDVAKITWTITQDPTSRSATGDVVWSPSAQRGYMRFVGLTPNDPTQFQYQLWIFDKTRDQAFPVDGGVFDVNSNGEVVVAINPKLHVNDLGMFAVTVEKPGGVVVSKRERIVVTAIRT